MAPQGAVIQADRSSPPMSAFRNQHCCAHSDSVYNEIATPYTCVEQDMHAHVQQDTCVLALEHLMEKCVVYV